MWKNLRMNDVESYAPVLHRLLSVVTITCNSVIVEGWSRAAQDRILVLLYRLRMR